MELHKPESRAEFADFYELAPEVVTSLRGIGKAVKDSGLEPTLVELVKVRASQLNGCAFCLNMHINEARKHGESEDRLHLLSVWREAPLYTERERAALAWTEALTFAAQGPVSDDVYETAYEQFSEQELAFLTATVAMINAWNRIGVAYRWTPDIKSG